MSQRQNGRIYKCILPLGSLLTTFLVIFFFEDMDISLSGTKVRMGSGAGQAMEILLWKEIHPGNVNIDVQAKSGSLVVHTKQILWFAGQFFPATLLDFCACVF